MSNKFDVNIKFGSDDFGICPKCRKQVHANKAQHIRHYQYVMEVEVCTDCKNDFIEINDIFFRGII